MQGLEETAHLVVGGAGFVGSNLVRRLLTQGVSRVVVVDNLLSAERSNLPDDARIDFIEDSIAGKRTLAHVHDEFDYIFHLATYHGNQSSIANPLADHDNNLLPTLKLYEHIKGFRKLRRLVYAASGCTLALHTTDTPEPTVEDGLVPFDLDSPYQISKVVGEFYSVYYHRQHALPTVRARFQNVYGPGEILGAGRWRGTPATVWRNVIPTFIYRALKHLPLCIENNGAATRDFIYVDDIVHGLLLCALMGESGDVYNLASGIETSILELATLINTMAGSPAPLEILPQRDWDHSVRRVGSTEKAGRCLGFKAGISLEEGIRVTMAWTREHMPTIDACVRKHARHMNVEGHPRPVQKHQ